MPVPRQSAQPCRCPGTAHPQANPPLNRWQCPINNLCAKATATAACHRGAAGETKALPRTGAGKQEMRWRWVQPGQDISLVKQFQLHSVLQSIAMHRSLPALQVQELARARRDNQASSEEAPQHSDICTGSSWASLGLEAI